jgi:hypothetical protein
MRVYLVVFFLLSQAALAGDFRFHTVYKKAFWQQSWFVPVVITGAVATAAAVTVFTGGAGAPAAGVGVSSVASAIAGGGPGSYMAGLSIVGGWFGGNAMLGAALLNGLSAGIIGGIATKATVGSLALLSGLTIERVAQQLTKKIAIGQFQASVIEISVMTATQLSIVDRQEQQARSGEVIALGIVLFFPLQPSSNIAHSPLVKNTVNQFSEISKKCANKEFSPEECQKRWQSFGEELTKQIQAPEYREWKNLSELKQRDFLALLLLLAQYPEKIPLFIDLTAHIQAIETQKQSFLWYLKGIAAVYRLRDSQQQGLKEQVIKDAEQVLLYAKTANRLEPKAVEPLLLQAMAYEALGQLNVFYDLKNMINKYDENHYITPNNLQNAYLFLGDIALSNQKYALALNLYHEAWTKHTNYLQSDFVRANVALRLAKANYYVENFAEAEKLLKQAKDFLRNEENAEVFLEEAQTLYNRL